MLSYNNLLTGNVAHPYQCFPGRCSSIYGHHITGNNDLVASACATDPRCKAFRYSVKHEFGYLCAESDARNNYDDWVLCKINPGKLSSRFSSISNAKQSFQVEIFTSVTL